MSHGRKNENITISGEKQKMEISINFENIYKIKKGLQGYNVQLHSHLVFFLIFIVRVKN